MTIKQIAYVTALSSLGTVIELASHEDMALDEMVYVASSLVLLARLVVLLNVL